MPSPRSSCPIACALDLFGDKWTLLIVRDMALGRSLYKEFLQSPEGISTNVLADRLKRLQDHGFVERRPLPHTVGRDAYYLTERGESLRPLLRAFANWGMAEVEGAAMLRKDKREPTSPTAARKKRS